MPVEMRPGVIAERMARLAAELETRSAAAVVATAAAVVAEAKADLTRVSHPYGTPTPASPGGPPARISGMLAHSVAATPPAPHPLGVMVRVGLLAGQVPPYGRTPTSRYGFYLEVTGAGLSHIRYPWLMPVVHRVGHVAAHAAVAAAFRGFGHL